MSKKRVKRVSSRAKSKSLPEKHRVYISMAVSAVILILAVIFIYPMIDDEGVVGKAWTKGTWYDEIPDGFYWEDNPVQGTDGGDDLSCNYVFDGDHGEWMSTLTYEFQTGQYSAVEDSEIYGCCPEKNYCLGTQNPDGKDDYTCYSPGSVYLNGEYLCHEGDDLSWLKCDGNANDQLSGDIGCDGTQWKKGIELTGDSFEVKLDDLPSGSSPDINFAFDNPDGAGTVDGGVNIAGAGTDTGDGTGTGSGIQSILSQSIVDGPDCDGLESTIDPLSEFYCDEDALWNICDEDAKDDVSDNNKYACDGNQWFICGGTNAGEPTSDGKFVCLTSEWQTCTADLEGTLLRDEDVTCFNSLWNTCDADNLNVITPDFDYYCDGNKWNSEFQLGDEAFYEVNLNEKKKSITINPTYSNIHVCDTETENVADIATVCYTESAVSYEKPIESISRIQKGGIITELESGAADDLLLLYEEEIVDLGDVKEVNAFLVKDITAGQIDLPFGSATSNFVNERRLALKFDEEYYLVSHPAEAFKLEKLKVTKLPFLEELTIQSIGNQYQFIDEDTDKAINFQFDGDFLYILHSTPGQMAAAFVSPKNLKKNYEFFFTKNIPISLEDFGNTEITVCNDDLIEDIQVLQICIGSDVITINKDELVTEKVDGKDVAFLYQYDEINNEKKGYVFLLNQVIFSKQDLDYTNFVDNMVDGRRLAVQFGDGLYLLEHSGSVLSLPKLNLVSYTESGKTVHPALGSEKIVDFLIPEGKITLIRNYLNPPPPFKINGFTKQQIVDTKLDLTKQLFATMSNHIPVQITTPGFGIISAHDEDLIGYKPLFKLTSTSGSDNHGFLIYFSLNYQIPKMENNALFYYFNAGKEGGKIVKSVKIYQPYDLDSGKKNHLFDNDFIEIFTSGNELALKLEGYYYLLGYAGATSEDENIFELELITLRLLNGTEEEFTGKVDTAAQSVTFPVLKGEVLLEIDIPNSVIAFSSKTAEDLVTVDFTTGNFSTLLTTENKVVAKGKTYSLCDTEDIKPNDGVVLLCYSSTVELLNKNKPSEINGQLFWYQGMVNGKKTVKISNIEELITSVNFPSWSELANKVKEGKSKAYKWKDQLFELIGGDKLEGYSLKTIPDGKVYPLQNVKSSDENLQNGTFVYNEHLLYTEQSWTNKFNIQFDLVPLDYKLLSSTGMNISDSITKFAYSVEAPLYIIQQSQSGNLREISLQELGSDAFYHSLFSLGTEKDVLLTSGDKITIKLINDTVPIFTIKK